MSKGFRFPSQGWVKIDDEAASANHGDQGPVTTADIDSFEYKWAPTGKRATKLWFALTPLGLLCQRDAAMPRTGHPKSSCCHPRTV